MIPQDVEVVMVASKEVVERAKAIGVTLVHFAKDMKDKPNKETSKEDNSVQTVPIITNPNQKKAKECALHLQSKDQLGAALRHKHIKYIYGFHELDAPPLINQVTCKQLVERGITVVFPFPAPDSIRWSTYERSMLPILEHFNVPVLFASFGKDAYDLRGAYEKESYYRLVLGK